MTAQAVAPRQLARGRSGCPDLPFPGAIHVLRLADLGHHDWVGLEQVLDSAERARASKFRFQQDRAAYVAAHGLLRRALAGRLAIDPASLRFRTRPGGKPALDHPGAAGIDFSLSHTRGCVACVIGDGVDVGIDIEREREPPLELGQLLAEDEIAWLQARTRASAPADFTALWCRKEAVSKALGLGAAIDFSKLPVVPGQPVELLCAGAFVTTPALDVKSAQTQPGFHLAVATAR